MFRGCRPIWPIWTRAGPQKTPAVLNSHDERVLLHPSSSSHHENSAKWPRARLTLISSPSLGACASRSVHTSSGADDCFARDRHVLSEQFRLGTTATGDLTLLLTAIQVTSKFLATNVRKAKLINLYVPPIGHPSSPCLTLFYSSLESVWLGRRMCKARTRRSSTCSRTTS